jgi:hypothetical protein
VDLQPGANIKDIDVKTVKVTLRSVKGVVLDDATGNRLRDADILMVRTDAPPNSRDVLSVHSGNGSFDFENVIPNSYVAVAFVNDRGVLKSGRTSVLVGNADVNQLAIRARPGQTVSGRIVVEQIQPDRIPFGKIRIQLRPDPPSSSGILPAPIKLIAVGKQPFAQMIMAELAVPGATATVEGDGVFSFREVLPWDYSLAVSSLPEGFYVKSVRYGNTDGLNQGIHVDGRSRGDIEIVLSDSAGRLHGRVVNDAGNPVANSRVVLVGDSASPRRLDLYTTVWTSNSGHFQIRSIPPGAYRLFAWEHVEEGSWQDAQILGSYADRSITLQIHGNDAQTIEVKVIPLLP